MSKAARKPARLQFFPATADRWSDLEALFGPKGACAGCWCLFWRQSSPEFSAGKGAPNRQALRRLVKEGPAPGILAYAGDEPIGWCAIAPRAEYPRLARSRILKPVDEKPVWSVTCFFVARAHRRRGVTVGLLKAAVDYAATQGASVVEGYPVEPSGSDAPDVFVYTGLLPAFEKAGFKEVARRSKTRPIMRRAVRAHRRA